MNKKLVIILTAGVIILNVVIGILANFVTPPYFINKDNAWLFLILTVALLIFLTVLLTRSSQFSPPPTPSKNTLPSQSPWQSSSGITTRQGISRRIVIGGLAAIAGIATVGVVGRVLLQTLSQQSSAHIFSPVPPTSPSPTLPPIGTILNIYRGHSKDVFAVAWSPDGKRIASASLDKTVQVWNAVDGGNVFTYRGHSNSVIAVVWSPNGKRIASGSTDGTVQVWDAANGGNVFTYRGHSDYVDAVAWSPDGQRIASGGDNIVRVWEAR